MDIQIIRKYSYDFQQKKFLQNDQKQNFKKIVGNFFLMNEDF